MAIFLIRHTTPVITQEYCYGFKDIDVADNFELLAQSVELKINGLDINTIYSSPLIRCSKLANRLFPNKEIVFDERIKEMNFGDWEGQRWKDIDKKDLMHWTTNFATASAPNGESLQIFYNRVIEFWNSIEKEGNVAIVSHAGTMRMIISKLLEIPLSKSFSIAMQYAQVIKLSPWDKDNFQVEFL